MTSVNIFSFKFSVPECEQSSTIAQRLFSSPLVWGKVRGFGGRPRAEGANRVEAPQAPRGVGKGCPPPHWRRGLGRGTAPPQNFFSTFGALWGYFLRFSELFWTQTAVAWQYNVWLVSLQVPELSMHWRKTLKECRFSNFLGGYKTWGNIPPIDA